MSAFCRCLLALALAPGLFVAFGSPLQAGPYEVNSAHQDFYFEINGNAITRVGFENERLAIEGKDLLMLYWDKEKPLRYVRQ